MFSVEYLIIHTTGIQHQNMFSIIDIKKNMFSIMIQNSFLKKIKMYWQQKHINSGNLQVMKGELSYEMVMILMKKWRLKISQRQKTSQRHQNHSDDLYFLLVT